MKPIEAIVAIALCAVIALPACIASDFNATSWSTGDGFTVTEYSILYGKLTSSERWLMGSEGTVLYKGSYWNGGQAQLSISPPKQPTHIFDNTPQVFERSISFSGFPRSRYSTPIGSNINSGRSFADRYNAFGAKYGGVSFKPLAFTFS